VYSFVTSVLNIRRMDAEDANHTPIGNEDQYFYSWSTALQIFPNLPASDTPPFSQDFLPAFLSDVLVVFQIHHRS
jgi:hypothetical protein